MELRICCRVSNVGWESPENTFPSALPGPLQPAARMARLVHSASQSPLRLPCSREARFPKGPEERTRGNFRVGATSKDRAEYSSPAELVLKLNPLGLRINI